MRSSTLQRAALSREKMEMLQSLASKQKIVTSPGVYQRNAREKELDILWKSLKSSQRREKTPAAYLTTGFVAGALSMFLITTMISLGQSHETSYRMQPKLKSERQQQTKAVLNIVPADKVVEQPVVTSQSYTVKNGDTLESISVRFYGEYKPSYIDKIQEANKLMSPHAIRVGQVLSIPLS